MLAGELLKIFDAVFAAKDLTEWRAVLDANGLVFGIVATVDDIPNDRQMIENRVLVPFADDGMLTIDSPLWVDGAEKAPPRPAPGIGEDRKSVV